ncbi:MAG: hypothetical protein A2428_08515 [Bdellovibrionales bacterium RIFOXYC1_FULL_54_43]|nr:MAG: hypothetical protein A2428_08515 [Bdellovibrionales bacterium RIFOXYC1_FULL_54_43]
MLRKPLHRFFGLFLLGLTIHLIARRGLEGDTHVMLDNVQGALACVREGQWSNCSEAGQFGLFQFLPAFLLTALGLSKSAVMHVLAYLSFSGFFLSLYLMYRGLRVRSRSVAILGLFVLLSGYDLWYANSSFAEMGSAFFILALAFVLVVPFPAGKKILLSSLLLFVSALTKETALPFLWVIVGLGLWVGKHSMREKGLLLLCATLSSVLAIAAIVGFNYFRFGKPYNLLYLDPAFIVPTLSLQVSLFFGLWFSPSGGVAFFWPSFFLLFPVTLWLIRRNSRNFRNCLKNGIVLAGIGALLALLSFGFARWWSPFGWAAWGPRLLLPWLPVSAFLLLFTYADEFQAGLARLGQNAGRFWIAGTLIVAASFPQFAILTNRPMIAKVIEGHAAVCADIHENIGIYYDCLLAAVWPKRWGILELYRIWPRPELFITSLLYSAFLLLMLQALRTTRES